MIVFLPSMCRKTILRTIIAFVREHNTPEGVKVRSQGKINKKREPSSGKNEMGSIWAI